MKNGILLGLIICLQACYVRPIYLKKSNCAFNEIIGKINTSKMASKIRLDGQGVQIFQCSMKQRRVLESNVLEWNLVPAETNQIEYPFKTDDKIQQDLFLVLGKEEKGTPKAWLITMVSRPAVSSKRFNETLSRQEMLPVRIIMQYGKWFDDSSSFRFVVEERYQVVQKKISPGVLALGYPMECGKNEKEKIVGPQKIENLMYVFQKNMEGKMELTDLVKSSKNKIGLDKPLVIKPREELGGKMGFVFTPISSLEESDE
jgi:hypothetical protein